MDSLQELAEQRPKTPRKKQVRKELIQYPIPEGGLDALPEDFDTKIHKPLRRKDFKNDWVALRIKAQILEHRAAIMRAEADGLETLGPAKDKKKAKRFVSMLKKLEELRKGLEAEGLNVDAILAKVEGHVTE